LLGRWKRRGNVLPRAKVQVPQNVGPTRLVQLAHESVDHDVADQKALPRNGLCRKVIHPRWLCDEQEVSEPVGLDPVQLFGHRHVEAPQAGFDVSDLDAVAPGNLRARHRRVYVADDDHQIRGDVPHDSLEAVGDHGDLFLPRMGADVQVDIRAWDLQLSEEHFAHLYVVVLPRVDED